MHKLTSFFLYAFLADGLLSIADLLGRKGTPGEVPNFLSVVCSLAVFILGVGLFFGMIVTPRLSKRMLLPALGYLGFSIVWAILYGQRGMFLLSCAQALLGLGLVVGFRNREGGGLQDFVSRRPGFTFGNFVGTGLLNSALGLVFLGLIALGIAQRVRGKLENVTGHYVTIQSNGVLLQERRFRREDREIRLVSMMHVAGKPFYDEVARTLPTGSKAVVLLEGVSDREGLLRGKLDYSNAARLLGFTSQQQSSFNEQAVQGLAATQLAKGESGEMIPAPSPAPALEYRRADMDAAEFRAGTLRFIQAFGELLQSADLRDALARYSESRQTFEQGSAMVWDDVLGKRNEHLLGEIRRALDTHTVVIIPWGALHMPGVQREIERWGFVETLRLPHEAIRFENKTLIGSLACLEWLPSPEAWR